MTSDEEERPMFVMGGYGRHRHQWVNNYIEYFSQILLTSYTYSCHEGKIECEK